MYLEMRAVRMCVVCTVRMLFPSAHLSWPFSARACPYLQQPIPPLSVRTLSVATALEQSLTVAIVTAAPGHDTAYTHRIKRQFMNRMILSSPHLIEF